ncbi:nucleoside-diphosphate-sugar epimerase [Labedella gwakjiensis]|uniref:Nucleoside-diphosphate-sugar epimerase n=1 Tax=Labedella gwakjiensis TaxID=390269 RepID=A0A2P8GRP0_9MICO|nr:SDR family oxidoreductase [Labedella gwakjiensis]PSL36627.1 nucleoside-diphosphate-sugar epimerase [Labedella gwakjiensis]RUQ84151.1 SDR family oxidoreductase [Labedella gwakjiensis]
MATIAIAGGHGKIALLLSRTLSSAGHDVRGIVRNPDQRADLAAHGALSIVLDLESTDVDTLATELDGVDAVVFAAGAGPGSTADRKLTVDRDAAVLLGRAAVAAGVRRYVLISSIGVSSPPPEGTDEVFRVYLEAKKAAEEGVRELPLDWTIIRPGSLTDDEPTGTVTLTPEDTRGDISRGDVAIVIAALLERDDLAGVTFTALSGSTEVEDALDALVS